MSCYFSAITALALIGGSVASLSVSESQQNILKKVFPDDLDKKYEKIIIERRNHYYYGLMLGAFISVIILNYYRIPNKITRTSLFFTIMLGTALIFYMIMPKSDYMLNHLKTPEQNKKWLEVYKNMKMRYFIGFLLGILAAIPLANIIC